MGKTWPKEGELGKAHEPILRVTMKLLSGHPKLHYHTWRDIGGLLGLILDIAFFGFVMIAALFVLILGVALLFFDYLTAPILAIISRIPPTARCLIT